MGELIGATLGHFRVEAKLGEGGMGVVYRAHDESLRRDVALKVLPESFTQHDEHRRRFLREARSAAAINHPNIATVHEIGEAGGRVFIAMELAVGETLRARMASPISVVDAVAIAKQIARGLAKAHEKGVVHRDLKPENVIVTSEGEVKILDFGLAKLREADEADLSKSVLEQQETASQITEEGRVLGTPAYMSPEQAAGHAADPRTDIFSLGVVLYEMVTGERPFRGTTLGEVIAAIVRNTPEAPSKCGALVGPELDAIILRCLAKRPEERFLASELVAALEAPHSPMGIARTGSGSGVSKRAPVATPSRTVPAVIALAVTAAIAFYAVRARDASPTGAPSGSTSSSAAVSAAPTVTTLTDHPPPPTKIPAAATAYASGMQAMRDNNFFRAIEHFERATVLDPSMAAGWFRLSLSCMAGEPEKKRSTFAKAVALRAQLTERDRAVMDALAPLLQRVQPDYAETVRNLEALTKVYPLDVELYDWMGTLRLFDPASLAAAERVIALDARDGTGWQNKGAALLTLGRLDEARVAFDRCAAINADSADCVMFGAQAEMVEGRCDDFERKARIATDRAPTYAHLQVLAMVSLGRPEATVRDVLRAVLAGTPEADRALFALAYDAQLALVSGDFARAAGLARRVRAAVAANATARSDYNWNYHLAMEGVGLAVEIGDIAGVGSAATDFVARSDTWTRIDLLHGVDMSLYLARLALSTAPNARFEVQRRAWIDARTTAEAYPGLVWTYGYAATAITADDASAALATLAKFAPLTPFRMYDSTYPLDSGIPDADIGRTFLLADRVDDALPYLRRAAASCMVFNSPFAHTRAILDLGKALERKSDKDGACAAYQRVLARWGAAKPRSVTADEARKRASVLGCAISR